jgi:tRNA(Ile)-lysidine synthase
MTQSLQDALQNFSPASFPLGVAFSGGADSTALLVGCARKWPGQVIALHVNHGLQQAASQFESHCMALCAHLQVPLRIARADAKHQTGQSPEHAARLVRYASLLTLATAQHAQPAIHSIAIAQHADDQVETILLALSRGAGVAGLSAMPAQWRREGIDFYRPFLQVSAADIRTWLAEQGVGHVEDPTNVDEAFTRNRIRAQLMPALQTAFPQFLDTFARSASHTADAQELLDMLASEDLTRAANLESGLLVIKKLQSLVRVRQGNVLRFWLKQRFSVVPSTAQLEELLSQVGACITRGHQIDIKVGAGFVRREGAVLNWYNP